MGGFKKDQFHFFGKLTKASGELYEGDWKEGVKEGKGTWILPIKPDLVG